jgi:hypothetical protein
MTHDGPAERLDALARAATSHAAARSPFCCGTSSDWLAVHVHTRAEFVTSR